MNAPLIDNATMNDIIKKLNIRVMYCRNGNGLMSYGYYFTQIGGFKGQTYDDVKTEVMWDGDYSKLGDSVIDCRNNNTKKITRDELKNIIYGCYYENTILDDKFTYFTINGGFKYKYETELEKIYNFLTQKGYMYVKISVFYNIYTFLSKELIGKFLTLWYNDILNELKDKENSKKALYSTLTFFYLGNKEDIKKIKKREFKSFLKEFLNQL